jgi:hypothetical protein
MNNYVKKYSEYYRRKEKPIIFEIGLYGQYGAKQWEKPNYHNFTEVDIKGKRNFKGREVC